MPKKKSRFVTYKKSAVVGPVEENLNSLGRVEKLAYKQDVFAKRLKEMKLL